MKALYEMMEDERAIFIEMLESCFPGARIERNFIYPPRGDDFQTEPNYDPTYGTSSPQYVNVYECQECWALVKDFGNHVEWHVNLEATP